MDKSHDWGMRATSRKLIKYSESYCFILDRCTLIVDRFCGQFLCYSFSVFCLANVNMRYEWDSLSTVVVGSVWSWELYGCWLYLHAVLQRPRNLEKKIMAFFDSQVNEDYLFTINTEKKLSLKGLMKRPCHMFSIFAYVLTVTPLIPHYDIKEDESIPA